MRFSGTLLLLILPLPALAQRHSDPLDGFAQYPQFRNLSGLAGGGYGVDVEGHASLSGPVAFSTPVAYVMGHNQWRIIGATMSHNALPSIDRDLGDGRGSNVTYAISYGQTFGRVNFLATYMIKSSAGDSAYNFQAEWIPGRNARWAVSLGIQDVRGTGGSAGEGYPTDRLSSRSPFGVATYQISAGKNPVFVSVGLGRHRFGRGVFGSLSWQAAPSSRLWVEQDGYGINAGVLLAVRPFKHQRTELTASLGLVRGQYFLISGGIGF